MNINELTNTIKVSPYATTPLIAEKLDSPNTSDIDVIKLFNEAKSESGNKHDLIVISKNLFTRKLRQFNTTNDIKIRMGIIADLLAILFFKDD